MSPRRRVASSACRKQRRSRWAANPDRQRRRRIPRAARRLARCRSRFGHSRRSVSRNRGIRLARSRLTAIHPRCYYRLGEHSPAEAWLAMIAGVTNFDGHITGAHGPGSIPRVSILSFWAKRRSTRRGVRWATFSATLCASAWRTTCSQPVKALRPCCRCAACANPANGRPPVGQSPRRTSAAADTATALHRSRR